MHRRQLGEELEKDRIRQARDQQIPCAARKLLNEWKVSDPITIFHTLALLLRFLREYVFCHTTP